jgi:hypothetical protein
MRNSIAQELYDKYQAALDKPPGAEIEPRKKLLTFIRTLPKPQRQALIARWGHWLDLTQKELENVVT